MTENEVWKDVVEYEGLYEVSDKGNVRGVARKDTLGRNRKGRMLKPGYTSRGYLQVGLSKNGKSKTRTVHRLVAEAFIPNPNGLPQVNHRDEDKDNNNVENLEWCDSKYNINYGTRSERFARTRSKKVRAVNIKTGEVLTFNSAKEAKKKGYPGVAAACGGVYNTINGKPGGDGRTYKGYRWSYEKAEGNESK